MWKFFENLPAEFSFIIIILGIIAIVIISLRGHLKFGKKTLELGGSENENSGTTILKRSCGDCLRLLMGEREKYEFKINQESNKVLKTQMSFAEQKLMEMQNEFMKPIIVAINKHVENNPGTDSLGADENIQYKLVYGLLKDVLFTIKDEIRRSFKENGFYHMENSDFNIYLGDRLKIIKSMLTQYIRNIFPDRSNIIRSEEILCIIENQNENFSKIFREIYTFAQTTRLDSDQKISEIKDEFTKWVDTFSAPKTPPAENVSD
jgi:uncharacterized protein involved in tolerance to divalent cations